MTESAASLAARFGDFVDYAESTADTPRPSRVTLDVAAHLEFTGRIVFTTDPSLSLYLDRGRPYHAERSGDESIARQLVAAGLITEAQFERGVVSLGDDDHVGRLFERDASIDRDAVIVAVERRRDDLVHAVAQIPEVALTADPYRRDTSGLDRWFLAADLHGAAPLAARASQPTAAPTPDSEASPAPAPSSIDDEFRIFWPDGTTQVTSLDGSHVEPAHTVDASNQDSSVQDACMAAPFEQTLAPPAAPIETPEAPAALDALAPPSAPEPVSAEPPPAFTLEPITIAEIPAPESAVPDDVANAVKRALQAIERASTNRSSPHAGLDLPELSLPNLEFAGDEPPSGETPAVSASPSTPLTPPSQPGPGAATSPVGFAPPTAAQRAEVLYAQSTTTDTITVEPAVDVAPPDAAPAAPVVFVDTDDDAADVRRGALRRLISSLRSDD